MNRIVLAGSLTLAIAFIVKHNAASDPPKQEARVTKIIREVNLLPSDAPPRSAVENDQVSENTALRTGHESRSELTFEDLTITRLGENTTFSFNKAGRSGQLAGGTILVCVPKDSGGGEFRSNAVTVGITGSTLIFQATPLGGNKLIVLEGGARLRLVKYPLQITTVRAGQMLDVKAGATKLPRPIKIDLAGLVKTHPLITDFAPLPSENLILAAIQAQQTLAAGKSSGLSGKPRISGAPKVYPTATPIFTPPPRPRVFVPRPRPTPRPKQTPVIVTTPKPTASPKETPQPITSPKPTPKPTASSNATPRSSPKPTRPPKGPRPPRKPIKPPKKPTPTPTPPPQIF